MKRNVVPSDAPYGSLLIEYDPQNPDPKFTPECIAYIESRQPGLTPRDIAKLDDIEWFAIHRYTRYLKEFAVPGLRLGGRWETCYVKRFNTEPYLKMLNGFLAYIPPDFSEEQADRWLLPGYRLTCPNGDRFYPVKYSGDFVAWRKRMLDNAEHFETLTARFGHGRFVVSDAREIEFADLDVAGANDKAVPDDF